MQMTVFSIWWWRHVMITSLPESPAACVESGPVCKRWASLVWPLFQNWKKHRIPAEENSCHSVFRYKYGYSIDRQIGYQLGSVRFHFQSIKQSLIGIECFAHDITDSFAAHWIHHCNVHGHIHRSVCSVLFLYPVMMLRMRTAKPRPHSRR